MADKNSSNNKTSINLDLIQLLNSSLESFHNAIGSSSIVQTRDRLREVLVKTGKTALSQLVLLDENGAITSAFITPPNLETSKINREKAEVIQQSLKVFETILLQEKIFLPSTDTKKLLEKKLEPVRRKLINRGEALPGVDIDRLVFLLKYRLIYPTKTFQLFLQDLVLKEELSFYWLAIIYNDFLLCTYLRDQVIKAKDGNYIKVPIYEVKQVDLNGGNKIIGKSLGDFRIPILFNVKEHGLDAWTKELVIIGSQWPSLGTLPQMSGFTVFSFGPGEIIEDRLKQQKTEIQIFSWLIFYAAFVYQTYGLSQASVEEPRRLREELSCVGWGELLRKVEFSHVNKREAELNKLIEQVLCLDSAFTTRRILREYSHHIRKEQSASVKLLRKQFMRLINPRKNKDKGLLFSALRHIRVLYPYIDDRQVLTNYLIKEVWPSIKMLLFQTPDDAICYPALSATEDIYQYADEELQAEINNSLNELVSMEFTSYKQNERLLETLLLSILHCKNLDGVKNLATPLSKILSAMPEHIWLDISNRLFSLLDSERREIILNSIDKAKVPSQDIIEQLRYNHTRLIKLENEQHHYKGRISTKIISVISQKGGVGKTLVSLGVASSLAEKHKVCLVELDFFGPGFTYLGCLNGSKEMKLSLNEYLWSNFMDELTQAEREEWFSGRLAWKHHFDELVKVNQNQRLEWTLQDVKSPEKLGLKIISCSECGELQDLMLALIMSPDGLANLRAQLEHLAQALSEMGYKYIIFDTPAELKEITLCATTLSLILGGLNIFVGTLFNPSLEPLLETLPLFYSQGDNYLLINKVRALDQNYVLDKETFVDFLATYNIKSGSDIGRKALSDSILDALLHLNDCSYILWQEKLDKFLSQSRYFEPDDFRVLANSFNKYVKSIIE